MSAGDLSSPGTDPYEAALGVGGVRSEATRRAILGAAREAFASRGYEHTTIRAIAASADIDPSMVMRYFGSKARLFSAAATMNLDIPDLTSVPARRRGEALVRNFVGRWENGPNSDALAILLRTAVTDETVAAQFQATINELVVEPLTALGDTRAAQRGALIGSQLLGLALCRYIIRLEPIASQPIEEVIAAVAPTIQRYLT
jgi:AcrR family transcriptional regulator